MAHDEIQDIFSIPDWASIVNVDVRPSQAEAVKLPVKRQKV
jgi:hypothetical protein